MGEFNMVLQLEFSGALIPKKRVLLKNPHENTDLLRFPEFCEKLKFTNDTYQTSPECLELLSEQNYKLQSNKFYYEEDCNNVRLLSDIIIEFLANNFTGKKNYDFQLSEFSKSKFWNLVDINLPLEKVIHIDSEIYWKRYYRKVKQLDKISISLERLSEEERKYTWKEIGISMKLSKYLENEKYEGWFENQKEVLMELISPSVKFIKVNTFKSISDYCLEIDENLVDHPIKNYHEDKMHHISMKVFRKLYNLTELYLNMNASKKDLGYNYERKVFLFSTRDIENLAEGLEPLRNLKVLHFSNFIWNLKKIKILIPKLKNVPIEDLQFLCCYLGDNCASTICEIFQHGTHLKHLRLSMNRFTEIGMSALAYSIQEFEGELITLDISRNPICDYGIFYLGRALFNAPRQVKNLNLSSIQVTEDGTKLIAKIIRFHTNLVSANIMCLPFGEVSGDYLVKGLVENKNVIEFDSRYCEITEDQEMMVQLLIDRNNYIYKNPYIGKRYEMDSDFPVDWVKRIKDKNLLNVLQRIENDILCKEYNTEVISLPENIPSFIPKDVRVQRDCRELVVADELLLQIRRPPKLKKKKSIAFTLKKQQEHQHTGHEPPKPETFTKEEFYKYLQNPTYNKYGRKYYF